MAKNRELVATFEATRNVFYNGDPDAPDYRRTIIASVSDEDGNEQTIKGDAAENQLINGMAYRFFGRIVTHHKYGDQFVFSTFVPEQPASEAGVVAYLSQLKKDVIDPNGDHGIKQGIGKGTAHLLWEQYGAKACEMLRERPALVAGETPRMSVEVAKAASAWLQRNHAIERAKIDLIGLLDGRGFPKKTLDLVIAKYGSKASEMIRANPYLLMQFRGCGFGLTDKLYLELGHRPDRLKRQALCIWSTIARDSEGHTWFPLAKVEAAIRANVAGSKVRPDKALQLSLRAGMLAIHTDEHGNKWIAEARKADNEARIAEYVALAAGEECDWPAVDIPGPTDPDNEHPTPTEHQSDQILLATENVIGCLAGGPGTGKTFVSAALISAIVSTYGYDSIAVCAPTGKAAVRLSEALRSYGCGVEAVTIHRLLGVASAAEGGWSFLHDENNPLEVRYVIIDESSMIDTDLMRSLFSARAPGTHYLFVGDHRQLAPVGHGCPFLDLQRAGVPTGELTEVRRNSGQIVTACQQIREANRFDTSPNIDPDNGDNLYCFQQTSPPEQIDGLVSFYRQLQASDEVDVVWDVQVLCAVNKKSPLSRKELNETLQGLLNPTGKQVKGNPFRIGDKVINLKNGDFPSADERDADDARVFVANGEQAEVMHVEPARTIARLQAPERLIVIPHGQQSRDDGDDNESAGSAGSWDLAYAISTHKSQGSEWPVVVLMLDEYPGAKRLCSRNWIYTAISRAKRLCLMIGKPSTAQQMAQRDGLKRKTFLTELITSMRPASESPTSETIVALSETEFRGLFLTTV